MPITYNLADTINVPQLDFGGTTSGTISFVAPSVAGTQSYILPTALPTVSGYLLSSTTAGVMSWEPPSGGAVGVSTLSVVTNNGFAGTVATPTTTPAITFSTTVGVSGTPVVLQGNGTAIQALALTTNVAAGVIGSPVFILRDSGSNTVTITAPIVNYTTSNLNVPLTLPETLPTSNGQVLQSNNLGVMSWVTPTAAPSNYVSDSYTSASNIAINDIFIGMAASVASFGQSYVADDSEVSFDNIEFHQKFWPSNTTIYPWITKVAYDDQSVNGVVTPTYVAMGGSSNASTPASKTIILTSSDGVNWTERSNTNATASLTYRTIVKGVLGTAPSQTSIWLAFSNGTSSPYLTSTDNGVTWSSIANPFGAVIVNDCVFDPLNKKFWVVTSGTTATTNLFSSTDGTTWTSVNSSIAAAQTKIIIGNNPTSTTGTFITLSSAAASGARSTDSGNTWTTYTGAASGALNGVWDSVNSRFVVSNATFQTSTSSNGASWTTVTAAAPIVSAAAVLNFRTSIAYTTSTGSTIASLALNNPSTIFVSSNYFLYSINQGTTVNYKYRNYQVQGYSDVSAANTNATQGVSDTKNIIFITTKLGNFIGFKNKAIWVDDGNGIAKAPLGTYKCLGRVGSLTTSYLWQRTA